MTLLANVVEASERVSATASRSAKIAILSELLGSLEADEVPIAAGFLSGTPRQGRVGVGYRMVHGVEVPPASDPSLTVAELDSAITAIERSTGSGSAGSRRELLEALLRRATAAEAAFVRRLLTGELRQGALAGLMADAVAGAAGVPPASVRRALMLSGDLPATAQLALEQGEPGLSAVGLELFRPVLPMLASTAAGVGAALDGFEQASVEWKLDGIRIQIHRRGEDVRVYTRNLNEITAEFPGIVAAVRALPVKQAVADGEALSGVTFLFDLLHLDGRDLLDTPLHERRAALEAVAGDLAVPGVLTSDTGEAERVLEEALAAGHEGVVVKDAGSLYAAGRRGKTWRKVKPVRTYDLVVLGAEWGHGRRRGRLSNLHLGARVAETGGFVMVGKTFKGLTDELLEWQTRELLDRRREERGITVLVRPELVVEIALDGVQASTRYPGGVALRFARVKRYRPDKDAGEADTIDALRGLLPRRVMRSWLEPGELRAGLGCMRLPADAGLAGETIAAALESGITVFDTAHAYGDEPGANERLLAAVLRGRDARIVTKGGMTRDGGGWVPDGRAKAIRAGCEASLEALGGLPVDLFLLHAPDPGTPWRTSIRALARLAEEGLVRRVGISNVNRTQLDEALELAPIAAVEVPLSIFDDSALRGGTVERCEQAGLALIAHSPLGGPKRVGRLGRHELLSTAAEVRGVQPAELALAWVLGVSPCVVAIPGARRPETARSAAAAAALELTEAERALVGSAFVRARPRNAPRRRAKGEVVLVMGIPGAGKTRLAETFALRGYERLNRDERGGTLAQLADELDARLGAGATRAVLDNTYLTRVSRSRPIEVARSHGLAVRCIWLDTPVADAQVNLVERLLDRFASLPSPEELQAARREPGLLAPASLFRAVRELESPAADEGLAAIERLPFERAPGSGSGGVFVAAAAAELAGDPALPHLVFDWNENGDPAALDEAVARLRARVSAPVEGALCSHGGGPPRCWCRPPLPGLPLAFARRHGIDPSRSTLIGTSPAHRAFAATLGARYLSPR